MTPEAQRIAISKACGWHCCGPYTVGRSGNQRIVYKGIHTRTSMQRELPDYLNDLNAIVEAEKRFSDSSHDALRYVDTLVEVIRREEPDPPSSAAAVFLLVSATAAQRAEAFLRTLGKWEEQS